MVDLHSHILPCVDDGAKTWEIAEEMCRIAIADGIRHVVCTPHANETYVYHREDFQRILQQLRNIVGASLDLSLGCDFHFSYENIQEVMAKPSKFLIEGTDYLLVELSDYAIAPAIGDALKLLISMGIKPIITHPERNLLMQQRPEQVLWFAQNGCLIQVTANSLTGFWGAGPKKLSRWLLQHDVIHVIATDAHDTDRRPPVLSKARALVADLAGEGRARALVEDNPRAIISGKPLPYLPEPIVG